MSDNELKPFNLSRDPSKYHYTNQGSQEVLSEKNDYKAITNAFKTLQFSPAEVNTIWRIVASILWLGNITFKSDEEGVISVADNGPLANAAKLLQVTETELKNALTQRVIAAHGDVMKKDHNVMQAELGRDALAKAIYERLFNWIIQRVNKSIVVEAANERKKFNRVIGVLDIYGFEIFDQNSFEQFCINYCNEKLQQLFIELVLKQEQEEYLREGIEWVQVDYFNNQIICDLIDKPHTGIIAIMDEACLTVGKITDEMLLEAMDKKLTNHAHYSSRQLKPMDKELKHREDFRIT